MEGQPVKHSVWTRSARSSSKGASSSPCSRSRDLRLLARKSDVFSAPRGLSPKRLSPSSCQPGLDHASPRKRALRARLPVNATTHRRPRVRWGCARSCTSTATFSSLRLSLHPPIFVPLLVLSRRYTSWPRRASSPGGQRGKRSNARPPAPLALPKGRPRVGGSARRLTAS